ncbi:MULTISPECIES: SMI1/KNR4 family protein [Brevibacillus]|uniref:SMI1/KNR4 family protein n=1 Tax=Brevibacillus TaxID=55080 RepID=UPI002E1BD230|nr:SMI1/KNR4 family protein [Brevibacillus borstelensis]
MRISQLTTIIKTLPNCIVHPSQGLPEIKGYHDLPNDVREFYTLCGGVSLFQNADYPVNIVSPQEFILANLVIVGDLCEEDISSNWYIIANDGKGEYLTIDLSQERLGKCYDSFFDRHGVVGESQVIALSFTEFLERLVESRGGYWYWLQEDFISLGDAYDGIDGD